VPFHAEARPELTAGRRIGVVLSHGFTGNPASIRPWAEALAAHGYAVTAPRLPGHGLAGDDWRAMNRTGWEDWYAEVRLAYDTLVRSCDAIVVGGLSMGGALTLRLAADLALTGEDDLLAGVVVVNPAVATRRLDAKALPVIKHLVGGLPGIGSDIKRPGALEYAYTRMPLKATHSMMRAWPGIVRDLSAIEVPLLYFRSDEDHVVDDLSETLILRHVGSHDVTLTRLHESYHVATLDHDAEQIYAESAAFVARVAEA